MSGSVGSDDGDMGFQIAPMVDVVFVLMLFFMVSAGQQVHERELSTTLPGPGVHARGDRMTIFLDISADGQVLANDAQFGSKTDKQLLALRQWLKDTQSFGGKDPVIIRPNPAARHERIVDVLDACSAAGIRNLTFG